MPSGYAKAGIDLDTLLEPWQAGDGYAAATGYAINDVDFNQRYAPASAGVAFSGTTGYSQNNADVGPRFAAKGTRQTKLPIDGQTFVAAVSVPAQSQGSAGLVLRLKTDGTYEVMKSLAPGGSSVLATGVWNTSGGSVGDFQALYSITSTYATAHVDLINDATTWASLSTLRQLSVSMGPFGPSSGSNEAIYGIRIQIRRSSNGAVVSDSACTFNVSIEGSV